MRSTLWTIACLSLLAVAPACQPTSNNPNVDFGGSPPDLTPGKLRLLSLGSNVTSLTTGESARFSALLTHSDGSEKIVGGQISSSDGKIKYGTFANDGRPGSFSLELSWTQINQAAQANFAMEEQRQFLVEFFDTNGERLTQMVPLRLHCNGNPACKGACLQTAALCPNSTTEICVAGQCVNGCYIDNGLRSPNSTNPDPNFGSCQLCDTNMSRTMWTSTTMLGQTCGAGLACIAGGQCNKAFVQTNLAPGVGLNDIWGFNANDVWAIGPNMNAYRSTDGGKNWTTLTTLPGAVARNAIWGPAAMNVYIVGASGSVIQSLNNGANWNTYATGTTQTLRSIWGSAADNIYVVGDNGTILRSVNQGASWTGQSSGTTNILYGVHGTGINSVIAVGNNGTILRSTNSTSWSAVQSGVTVQLNAVRAVSADTLYAVGASGTVLKSVDNGANWTKLLTFPATASNAMDVWGVDANDVYVATNNAGVYRTTDGGQNWKQLYIPGTPTLSGIYGFSSSDIYVSGFNYVAHHP
jgi:photosystem II stability/assembly factor-like uncharacterized protein